MQFALAAAVVVLAVVAGLLLVVVLRRRPASSESVLPGGLLAQRLEDLGALKSQVSDVASTQTNLRDSLVSLQTALKGLETKMVETTGAAKDSVIRDFQEARRVLDTLKSDSEVRKGLEKDLQDSTRRIEAVIAGSRSRGKAGEDILVEAFKQFPPNIIETNFRVKGRVVEYALILADGKRVPIDSKWTNPELVERLAMEGDAAAREAIANQIEKTLLDKVKEVTKYIDPATTVSWGIAAVPDSVYAICKRTHLDAFRQNVVVMPYGLTVIYLLSLYHLHLQYCRSVDVEKLEGYLGQIERGLETIDRELENKVSRGATMITNALGECKQVIGGMRGATAYLRSLPAGAVQLEGGDAGASAEPAAQPQGDPPAGVTD